MTSQPLNRPCGVDVLEVLDNTATMARFDNSWNSLDEADFQAARAAVADLIEAARDYREGTKCHLSNCVYCHDRSIRMDAALAAVEAKP
jgi:hypothetical protein